MPRMNGTEPKIEIFKPFGEAFELTKKILFQPFDLKKWLVIGFAAWLANLGGGGGGFNYRYNQREEMQKVNEALSQIPHSLLVTGICVLVCFVLVLIVLFAWLRARGCFMFIECIAKNRGAIAEPWRDFRNEGNSYFLFSLLVGFAFLIFAALLSFPFTLPIIRGVTFLHIHDVYLISTIAAWAFVVILLVLAWSLIANFMVPVMYRQRCRALTAFGIVVRLITAYPGEILLYCLFLIVLAFGHGDRGMRRDLRNLLHRCDSLYRHRDFAAGLCLASFVFAFVSAAIRLGLRCVGDLHATGIFADLVEDGHAATTHIVIESAA